MQRLLQQTVEKLVERLRGISALMLFKIQLSVILRYQIAVIVLQIFKKLYRMTARDLAHSLVVYLPFKQLHVGFAGTAASVAYAVYQQSLVYLVGMRIAKVGLGDCQRRCCGVVCALRRHMRKHLAAVYASPYKSLIRKFVLHIPSEFYRHKILSVALTYYLRQ